MKIRTLLTGTVLLLMQLAGDTQAATQSVIANIAFDMPLAITKNNDIDFGLVAAARSGTYVISPTGTVTASNGGHALGGLQQGGSLTIAGSPTQAIDISAGNYAAHAGVIPSAATCLYDNGAAAPCALASQAAPDKGKPLLIGVTVTVDGSQKTGDYAAATFDVIVNYH